MALTPEEEKGLLKTFHAQGMTNKQVQAVLNKYADVVKTGISLQQQQELNRSNEIIDSVHKEFEQAWGGEFSANQKAVYRGFMHLADDQDRADIAKIGADPKITYRILTKVLAKVGAGLDEDTQIVLADGATVDSTLEELRKSPAYLDANHADHKKTVDKVTALYGRRYPGKGAHVSAVVAPAAPAAK